MDMAKPLALLFSNSRCTQPHSQRTGGGYGGCPLADAPLDLRVTVRLVGVRRPALLP